MHYPLKYFVYCPTPFFNKKQKEHEQHLANSTTKRTIKPHLPLFCNDG